MTVNIKLTVNAEGLAIFTITNVGKQQAFTATTLIGAMVKANIPAKERAGIVRTIHQELTADTFQFHI